MIILDRFEGDYAVIEIDGEMVDVERCLVDEEVKEGDVLTIIDGIYYRDDQATKKRKQYIEDKFKDMWED
ncbi:DUF3006 domain-containing protein [Alkaliphilus sp. MSJ-5]|uniref:DUF3006 domain-containing protein n=1 Tax=Alkaliphilus flagellatus TaxID=2841507 RepID=A0ABS6FZ88_9FIRM|nr:DUF3006 domain-containing protein [Alkaliphilus flagellatus]MBU5675563.1 DUF3006 domain-containing protein [Alkaliphilus flagellatus]